MRTIALLIIISITSCSIIRGDQNQRIKDNEDLAFQLSQFYGSDQTIRKVNNSKEGIMIMQKIDSINFVRIIKFIKEHGYPNEKLLGKSYKKHESVSLAAPAILLHNSSKVVQEPTFNLLKKEVEKGNMKPEALALILDKYYVYYKGYSLYHTQLKKACIENKEIVNKARLEIGLSAVPDSFFTNTCNEKTK
jgi:hypothetical protein